MESWEEGRGCSKIIDKTLSKQQELIPILIEMGLPRGLVAKNIKKQSFGSIEAHTNRAYKLGGRSGKALISHPGGCMGRI